MKYAGESDESKVPNACFLKQGKTLLIYQPSNIKYSLASTTQQLIEVI
jgi:hypothetical protein